MTRIFKIALLIVLIIQPVYARVTPKEIPSTRYDNFDCAKPLLQNKDKRIPLFFWPMNANFSERVQAGKFMMNENGIQPKRIDYDSLNF